MSDTTLGDFLDAAWSDHVADPQGVARRLAEARPRLVREPAQFAAFLQFAEHLLLGHLGDTEAIQPWLADAQALPEARPALERARLATQLLQGAALQPDAQPAALQVRALGTAINGSAARGQIARARMLLDEATRIGEAAGGDALKALAAACNNAASQLLEGAREPQADTLMIDAAERARVHWGRAGTWMNAERADYLVALCAAAVGDAGKALAHARACLAACVAHEADAFERFFAHEALARSQLAAGDRAAAAEEAAQMRALLAGIDDSGSRAAAQSSLDKLAALVNPA